MKTFLLSRSAFLFFVLIAAYGCKTSTSLRVMKAADVTVPEHIQKIALINRTRASKENKNSNIIEGILTGEGIGADKEGAEECLFGLRQALTRTPRFEVIQPAGLDLRGTGTGEFAQPLSWADVRKICEENKADAVIALEAFDSDSRMHRDTRPVTVTNKDGSKTTVPEYIATLNMRLTCGWRIYDLKNERIIDEHRDVAEMGFDSKGPTPQAAESGLPWRRDCVKRTGGRAGDQYCYRIAPMWITVSREYYKGGSDDMKDAYFYSRRNNWEKAAEIWKKESTNPSRKVAGRACFNMAVASEVEGKLDVALDWANKAWKEYGEKAAPRYIGILKYRMDEKERLKEQMK